MPFRNIYHSAAKLADTFQNKVIFFVRIGRCSLEVFLFKSCTKYFSKYVTGMFECFFCCHVNCRKRCSKQDEQRTINI
jgi:hypothetical protein